MTGRGELCYWRNEPPSRDPRMDGLGQRMGSARHTQARVQWQLGPDAQKWAP